MHDHAEQQALRVHRDVVHRSATRLDPFSRFVPLQPRGPPLPVTLMWQAEVLAAIFLAIALPVTALWALVGVGPT